ncbi:MAG TPA: protein arginine kinase [Rhabdochlamydiaceae bacterium]|jgi:protein arginine kinase
MKEKSNLPPSLIAHTPWEAQSNPIWPATTFTLHRNLSHYNFPPKLGSPQLQQTLSALSENLLKSSSLQNPIFLQAESLSANDKEFLYEHFLCPEGFQNTLAGQGFVIDARSHFLALINIDDHLQMRLIESQGKWEEAFNALNQMEIALGSHLDFAFSPRFGYLTSDPRLCGTGLVIQAYLHLPALIHTAQLPETLQKQKEESISSSGMGGSLNDLFGDLLVLHNSYTLGLTEENILNDIRSTALKLSALEKTLRAHLKEENNLDMKDQISRAFGLMVHSYQLQTKEALDALSLIKLGLDLGWIEGITDSSLNTLFFKCRRAHLGEIVGEHLSDPHDIARKRAEFMHEFLPSIHLKIDH